MCDVRNKTDWQHDKTHLTFAFERIQYYVIKWRMFSSVITNDILGIDVILLFGRTKTCQRDYKIET